MVLTKHITKSIFLTARKFPINIIIGNESADPDSIFGAISLAYLNYTNQEKKFPQKKSEFTAYLKCL